MRTTGVYQGKVWPTSLTILAWISEVYATTTKILTTRATGSRGGGSQGDVDDDTVPIPKAKGGVIAGIVLGCLFGVALLILLVVSFLKRRANRKRVLLEEEEARQHMDASKAQIRELFGVINQRDHQYPR